MRWRDLTHLVPLSAFLACLAACSPSGDRAPARSIPAAESSRAAPAAARIEATPTADTFEVITDSMVDAARAAGRLLPHTWPHFDHALVAQRAGVICYRYPRFVVVLAPNGDGSDYTLLARESRGAGEPDSRRCAADSLPGDFVLREQDNLMGIRGDTLWAESGDLNGTLTLYDLSKRRRLIELPEFEIAAWPDEQTVKLWMSRDTVPHSRCPTVPSSMIASIDSLYLLHLVSLRLEPTGDVRCSARQ